MGWSPDSEDHRAFIPLPEKDDEYRLAAHSGCSHPIQFRHRTDMIALAKEEHPYEVPGISTRTITGGNPDYLAWIAQETALSERLIE
jgi:uncharacterized protein involved in tolerance to divalent cations